MALICPVIVKGRCFMAKYPQIHDDRTISDFMAMSMWSCGSMAGTNTRLSLFVSPQCEDMMNAAKTADDRSMLMNRTGSTAFPVSDFFLEMS